MADLAGRTAIISGGLGSLGRAIAREAACAGADIAIGDILKPEESQESLEELRRTGRRAVYDEVDVSDPRAVEAWIGRVEKALDTPDVIIPNAAVVTAHDIRSISPEQWLLEMDVNLNGVFYLARGAANRLLALGRPGHIVMLGSWAGHAPHPDIPAYCVSKAGLRMLCRCLALNLAPAGILVNEVAPGFVSAGLSRTFHVQPQLKEQAERWVPAHRLIEPKEVAAQVIQLCDKSNRNITGTVVVIDGGLSLTNVSHGERKY
jgi:glucose 1-dehydrogenase